MKEFRNLKPIDIYGEPLISYWGLYEQNKKFTEISSLNLFRGHYKEKNTIIFEETLKLKM